MLTLPRSHGRPLAAVGALLLLAVACSDPVSTPTEAPQAARAAARAPTGGGLGTMLVAFRAQAVPADFRQRVEALGGRVVLTLPEIGVASVRIDGAGAARLARAADVQAVGAEPVIPIAPARARAYAPAQGYEPALEPFFPFQWGLRMIDADDAIRAGFTGRGALIGIIDSGIYYDHPDLAPNYVGGRNFFAPYCADDPASLPSSCDPDDPIDDHGHGSHVAGIVAAAANGIGVIGVAPDAKLIAVKVCGPTIGCPAAAIIAGMLYAADQGVDAMNISLGGFSDQRGGDAEWVALKRAANYVHARGSLVVNGAGNDGVDLDRIPGFIKAIFEQGNVLVVSAVGPDAEAASIFGEVYTNTGGQVDVAAPGGSLPPVEAAVLSTWSPLSRDLPGALYVFAVGTSQAAPHVTGTAAQIVGAYGHLQPSRISAIIRKTATDLGKRGHDPLYGQGLVNVAAAVGLDDGQPD